MAAKTKTPMEQALELILKMSAEEKEQLRARQLELEAEAKKAKLQPMLDCIKTTWEELQGMVVEVKSINPDFNAPWEESTPKRLDLQVKKWVKGKPQMTATKAEIKTQFGFDDATLAKALSKVFTIEGENVKVVRKPRTPKA